jgi:hypothetical protein
VVAVHDDGAAAGIVDGEVLVEGVAPRLRKGNLIPKLPVVEGNTLLRRVVIW